jgi:hypothetical protein
VSNLSGLGRIFPSIEIIDGTKIIHHGVVYYGGEIPRILKGLEVSKTFLCSLFEPDFKKPRLLFMCSMLHMERGTVRVTQSFSAGRPYHDGTYTETVEHLLNIISVHRERKRQRKKC